MSRWVGQLVILAAVITTAAGTVWAQEKDQALMDQLQSELDRLSRDVAEEYLDILESLRDVLDDYADYTREAPADAGHQPKTVELLRQNLRKGSYSDNAEKLLDDLYQAIEEIKKIENDHRVKFNTNSPSCCRLDRSLRKELVIVAELVEDYTDTQSGEVLHWDEISNYVAAAMKALAALESAKKGQGHKAEELRKAIESLRALGLEGRVIVIPDEAPEAIIPELPDIPDMPEIPEPPGGVYSRPRGRSSVNRGERHQAQGQVTVSNSSWPIVIENSSGDVIITGGDGKTLSATLNLEVASTSRAKEREYLDRTVLAVGKESNRYTVTVDLPRLSDHRTELLGSTLEVSLPRGNKIECTSAFGQVLVSDINARVTIDADNSSIDLERVTGGAAVHNSMGSVTLTDISGAMDIETSYAPIKILRCNGTMLLENQYSLITLDDCRGNVEIGNTGQIEISRHEGNLTIDNAYGRIEIDRVEGNLFVKNGYQAIVITDISGSAELENQYAEISVEEIGGSLSVTNNNGSIFVEALAGPVELSNYYGNTSISLGRAFKGGSTISSTGGTVKVVFVDQPNLVLAVHTVGGSISSSLPLSVRTRGESKSAELVLGEGGETLEISGTGSAIIVQGR